MRGLLGDRVTDVRAVKRTRARSTGSPSGASFRDYFKAFYGPTIATYEFTPDPRRGAPGRRPRDLGDEALALGEPPRAEYLVLVATRR